MTEYAANPFDRADGRFRVLRNHEGRHSLWPGFADLPPGWQEVHPEDSRDACLAYVREHFAAVEASVAARAAEPAAVRPEDA